MTIKHGEAARRLMAMQADFDAVLRLVWVAIRERILDWWDEPQIAAMLDDGCPNTNETTGEGERNG